MNWLLLRGLGRDARHWDGFERVLEERVPGARSHCLDLPGVGLALDRPSPLSVPGIAEDVRARWLALREAHPGPWGLCGISLGGMTTLAWIDAHPDDFERAVAIHPSAFSWDGAWTRMRPRAWAHIAATAALFWSDVAYERMVMSMVSNVHVQNVEMLERFARQRKECGVRLSSLLRQLWAAAWFGCPKEVEPPLLVVRSKRDLMVHPVCSERVARQLGAPLVTHEFGGHELTLDDPEWVADRIGEWLAR